jgi:hypothetical protein
MLMLSNCQSTDLVRCRSNSSRRYRQGTGLAPWRPKRLADAAQGASKPAHVHGVPSSGLVHAPPSAALDALSSSMWNRHVWPQFAHSVSGSG